MSGTNGGRGDLDFSYGATKHGIYGEDELEATPGEIFRTEHRHLSRDRKTHCSTRGGRGTSPGNLNELVPRLKVFH